MTRRRSHHQVAITMAALLVFVSRSGGVTHGDAAGVQGEWSLNRELTAPPPDLGELPRRPESRSGRGGFTGRLGGDAIEGRRVPSENTIRQFKAIRRRIEEVPQRLVITVEGTRVQIADEIGRVTLLIANGKRQDRLSGDGEFRSITRLDASRLVVEEDFDGPTVSTTYRRVSHDEHSRLHVTLHIERMPAEHGSRDTRRAPFAVARVYDAHRPVR